MYSRFVRQLGDINRIAGPNIQQPHDYRRMNTADATVNTAESMEQ